MADAPSSQKVCFYLNSTIPDVFHIFKFFKHSNSFLNTLNIKTYDYIGN